MKKIGMIVEFKNEKLIWGDVIVPVWRSVSNIPNPTLRRAEIKQFVQPTSDTKVTREATEIIVKILGIKYEKYNLKEISQSAHQLDTKEQVVMIHLLKGFQYLFYGTLVNFNTDPIEIKHNPEARPLSIRYYPVPHINK